MHKQSDAAAAGPHMARLLSRVLPPAHMAAVANADMDNKHGDSETYGHHHHAHPHENHGRHRHGQDEDGEEENARGEGHGKAVVDPAVQRFQARRRGDGHGHPHHRRRIVAARDESDKQSGHNGGHHNNNGGHHGGNHGNHGGSTSAESHSDYPTPPASDMSTPTEESSDEDVADGGLAAGQDIFQPGPVIMPPEPSPGVPMPFPVPTMDVPTPCDPEPSQAPHAPPIGPFYHRLLAALQAAHLPDECAAHESPLVPMGRPYKEHFGLLNITRNLCQCGLDSGWSPAPLVPVLPPGEGSHQPVSMPVVVGVASVATVVLALYCCCGRTPRRAAITAAVPTDDAVMLGRPITVVAAAPGRSQVVAGATVINATAVTPPTAPTHEVLAVFDPPLTREAQERLDHEMALRLAGEP